MLQIPQEGMRDPCVQSRNTHPGSKKCFCFGIPTRIPSSDSVAAGWIRLDQSWCGSSDSSACSVSPRADFPGPAAAGWMLLSWTMWMHIKTRAGIVEFFAPEQTDTRETSLTTTEFNWIYGCAWREWGPPAFLDHGNDWMHRPVSLGELIFLVNWLGFAHLAFWKWLSCWFYFFPPFLRDSWGSIFWRPL